MEEKVSRLLANREKMPFNEAFLLQSSKADTPVFF